MGRGRLLESSVEGFQTGLVMQAWFQAGRRWVVARGLVSRKEEKGTYVGYRGL